MVFRHVQDDFHKQLEIQLNGIKKNVDSAVATCLQSRPTN